MPASLPRHVTDPITGSVTDSRFRTCAVEITRDLETELFQLGNRYVGPISNGCRGLNLPPPLATRRNLVPPPIASSDSAILNQPLDEILGAGPKPVTACRDVDRLNRRRTRVPGHRQKMGEQAALGVNVHMRTRRGKRVSNVLHSEDGLLARTSVTSNFEVCTARWRPIRSAVSA